MPLLHGQENCGLLIAYAKNTIATNNIKAAIILNLFLIEFIPPKISSILNVSIKFIEIVLSEYVYNSVLLFLMCNNAFYH